MARKKKRGESIYAYFQRILEENPEWLGHKSNEEILKRYRTDHGIAVDQPVEKSIVNALNNKKSQMRKGLPEANGAKVSGRGRGRGAAKTAGAKGTIPLHMQTLEEQIDDCLATALLLDREGLENVIRLLRNARNEVVLKIGPAPR